MRLAVAAHAAHDPVVMVKRAVLLHEHHDVLDVLDRAGPVIRRNGESSRDAVREQCRGDAAACELEEPAPTDVRHSHHQPDIHGRRPCAALVCDITGRAGPVHLSAILGNVTPAWPAGRARASRRCCRRCARRPRSPARDRRPGTRRRARRPRRWCRSRRPREPGRGPRETAPRAPSLITQVASKPGTAARSASVAKARSGPSASSRAANALGAEQLDVVGRGQVDGHAAGEPRGVDRGLRHRLAQQAVARDVQHVARAHPRRVELGAVEQRGDAAIGGHRPLAAGRCAPTRPRRRGPRTTGPQISTPWRASSAAAISLRRIGPPLADQPAARAQRAGPRGDVRGLAARGEADRRGRVGVGRERARRAERRRRG